MAEAAVKKLKVMIDRHTDEYELWHRLVPMAQAAVNQRKSAGTGMTPFMALFGRQHTPLASLEQPGLLPDAGTEQLEIHDFRQMIARMHKRLKEESDSIKETAAAQDKWKAPGRRVAVGDIAFG